MRKRTVIFPCFNILAMLCLVGFVLSARDLALIEERDAYDFSDSAGFFLIVAPVLLLCVVADIIWAGMALLAIFRRGDFQTLIACVIFLVLWAAVFLATRELASLPPNPALQGTASPTAELGR
jgi:hypothetical protein